MSLPALNGSDTNFGWKFVLSKDDVFDDGDTVFETGMISDEEMAELQVQYIARIILPSIVRTFGIIRTIIIHTIVCFPIDSINFDVWIIGTFCLILRIFLFELS